MNTVTIHNTPVDSSICQEVLLIVQDNVSALSMSTPSKKHPLFDGYKALLVEEIRNYIAHPDLPQVKLITCSNDSGKILGFLLYGLVQTSKQECNIYYTAVDKPFRGMGVMRSMMKVIFDISSDIGLSCSIPTVPIYKKFGFRIVKARETQIVMFVGDPIGITPVFDAADLKRLSAVEKAFYEAAEKTSYSQIISADKKMKIDLETEKTKAKRFVQING